MTRPLPGSAPSVEVIVPTRNRPDLLRSAVASAVSQEYDGPLSVTVVFDGTEPDVALVSSGPVPVRVLPNTRSPGLPGARNTGLLASSAELVAFLDDDDVWLPRKLALQVQRLAREPDAEFVTTAIQVRFDDRTRVRLAGGDEVPHRRLLESRMSMLHSSTFLARRKTLLELGLVDEGAPQGQNEDWDLLLRASRRRPIAHVDQPLVAVRWGSTSLFAHAWESKIAGARWVLSRHPDIRKYPVAEARVLAQIAFAHAAVGERRTAVKLALQSARQHLREPRAYLALLVASGVVSPSTVLRVLHRRGHGV